MLFKVSSGEKVVESVDPKLWHDPWCDDVARQQLSLVYHEFSQWITERSVAPFEVFLELVEHAMKVTAPPLTILEVGCGVGHYGHLLDMEYATPPSYLGVDVSEAMIESGDRGFPHVRKIVSDGERLPEQHDNSHDLVVLGSCLNHTPDWMRMLETAKRVSRKWIMLHRMPMLKSGGTVLVEKDGYGHRMAERHFSEPDFPFHEVGTVREIKTWSHSGNQFQASYLLEV